MIFGDYNFYPELIGLNPRGGRKNVIGRTMTSVTFLPLILMMSVFFILNLHRDLDEALLMMPTFVGYAVIIAVYFLLLLNREIFYRLWRELEDVVLESV